MPFLVPVAGVIVKRNGIKMTPPADEPFEFTDEEAMKFLAADPPPVRRVMVEQTLSESVGAATVKTPAKPGRKGKASVPDDLGLDDE
jgi:hypothetical protein